VNDARAQLPAFDNPGAHLLGPAYVIIEQVEAEGLSTKPSSDSSSTGIHLKLINTVWTADLDCGTDGYHSVCRLSWCSGSCQKSVTVRIEASLACIDHGLAVSNRRYLLHLFTIWMEAGILPI